MFQKIKDLFSKSLPAEYAGSRGWSTYFASFGKHRAPSWCEADEVFGSPTDSLCELSFRAHAVIASCTKLKANVAAQPRLEIGFEEHGSEAWQAVAQHDLLNLFDSPMRDVSRNRLIKQLVMGLCLTGKGYAQKLRNRGGSRVVGLMPLPASWVHPERGVGTDRYFSFFRVRTQEALVPVSDMLWLLDPDPNNPSAGVGFVEQAWRAFILDVERELYQGETTVNLKVPGVVVHTERNLGAEERERAREEFRDRFGRGKRGDVAFLGGGGKSEISVLNPLGDMDWPGLTGLSETRICAAAQVPPILVHTRAGLDRATYSNFAQAKRAFYLATMAPLWEDVADGLTLSFKEELGPRLRFRFRYDELPEFQEDNSDKAKRIVQLFSAGLISWASAVSELGYDPEEMAQEVQAEVEQMQARRPQQQEEVPTSEQA